MEYNIPDNGLLPTVSDVRDNYKTGYIKIFRSLKNHWIWSDDKKLKWWLDILLSVNYSDQKVLIKGQLIECKKGQSVQSLETWAKSWRTTKKTVQTFFRLLEKDAMLTVENVKFTTRITVCNFESYNGIVNADDYGVETDSKRRLPPNNKGNKDNKEDTKYISAGADTNIDNSNWLNDKRKILQDKITPFLEKYGKELCNDFYQYWGEPHKKLKQIRYESQKYFDVNARLRTFKNNVNKRTT